MVDTYSAFIFVWLLLLALALGFPGYKRLLGWVRAGGWREFSLWAVSLALMMAWWYLVHIMFPLDSITNSITNWAGYASVCAAAYAAVASRLALQVHSSAHPQLPQTASTIPSCPSEQTSAAKKWIVTLYRWLVPSDLRHWLLLGLVVAAFGLGACVAPVFITRVANGPVELPRQIDVSTIIISVYPASCARCALPTPHNCYWPNVTLLDAYLPPNTTFSGDALFTNKVRSVPEDSSILVRLECNGWVGFYSQQAIQLGGGDGFHPGTRMVSLDSRRETACEKLTVIDGCGKPGFSPDRIPRIGIRALASSSIKASITSIVTGQDMPLLEPLVCFILGLSFAAVAIYLEEADTVIRHMT